MSIETDLTRIADAIEKIAASLTAETIPPAVASAEPRGRGRPRKDAPGAAPVVVHNPSALTATADFDNPPPAASREDFDAPVAAPIPTVTAEDVRAALIALQKAKTPEFARRVLKETGGADTIKSLPPERYAAVVAAAKAVT